MLETFGVTVMSAENTVRKPNPSVSVTVRFIITPSMFSMKPSAPLSSRPIVRTCPVAMRPSLGRSGVAPGRLS